jgi:hypothetical protein
MDAWDTLELLKMGLAVFCGVFGSVCEFRMNLPFIACSTYVRMKEDPPSFSICGLSVNFEAPFLHSSKRVPR